MNKPIKIAIMVRSFIPMPRPSDMIYAPIDIAVAIAKGLGARGHQVTLFSPLGTEVHGENITVETMNLRPLVRDQDDFNALLDNTELLAHGQLWLWDRYMVNEIYKRAAAGEFDVLHFHHPESALSAATEYPGVKTAYTLHDPIYPWYKELFELFASDNQHFISISNNQRRDAPDLPYLKTSYNGIDMELFTFSEEHDDYLLISGRITAEKGIKEAIQVAKDSGHKLLIIGPVNHGSQDYFDRYIKPELNEKILYLGRMDQDQLVKYYQKAKAFLTPIQWEEPFGLTTVEAMACGTPVISLHRGAAPEIIEDGKTGFIVHSINEMVEAVGKIDQINRQDCRDRVVEEFSNDCMVDRYEKIFCELVDAKADADIKATEIISPGEIIKTKLEEVKQTLKKII
ncbi:glycosyltransferase family 4 protein, partial [Candidatus Saccharibacteria bacterium]|nr:glycosyltransferase family 4 protein [Candidatus Saccharibacteria bacterium]